MYNEVDEVEALIGYLQKERGLSVSQAVITMGTAIICLCPRQQVLDGFVHDLNANYAKFKKSMEH